MAINETLLKSEEKAVYALRSLYSRHGYSQFKMSKFEEYDLYVKNKDFLVSDGIIAFTDTNGRLKALKPDVTLSIINNSKDSSGVQKLYYNENVYRISGSTHTYKEIMQAGLECIGQIGAFETSVLPYEDCCTVFTPKHPRTRPTLELIEKAEGAVDWDEMIERAIAETKYEAVD